MNRDEFARKLRVVESGKLFDLQLPELLEYQRCLSDALPGAAKLDFDTRTRAALVSLRREIELKRSELVYGGCRNYVFDRNQRVGS
jgi:hypothetical protein